MPVRTADHGNSRSQVSVPASDQRVPVVTSQADTHHYVEADLAMKEAALQRLDPPADRPARFKARDRLLAFLESL